MAITMADIAEIAGVSKTTVSDVLNNKEIKRRVGNKTVEKVREIIKETKYIPNIHGRALSKGNTMQLGVIAQSIQSSFHGRVTAGFIQEVERLGYSVILSHYDCREEDSDAMAAYEKMINLSVDGIAFLDSIPEGLEPAVPVVATQMSNSKKNLSSIDMDYGYGSRLAAQHLIDLNHKVVGLCGSKDTMFRFKEAEKLFKNAGVKTYSALSMNVFDLIEQGVTAIFCSMDYIALQIIGLLAQKQIRVPQDCSIIGYDNLLTVTFWMQPRLTTVAQPQKEYGIQAANLLIDMIKGKKETHITLKPKLLIGETTKANI